MQSCTLTPDEDLLETNTGGTNNVYIEKSEARAKKTRTLEDEDEEPLDEEEHEETLDEEERREENEADEAGNTAAADSHSEAERRRTRTHSRRRRRCWVADPSEQLPARFSQKNGDARNVPVSKHIRDYVALQLQQQITTNSRT